MSHSIFKTTIKAIAQKRLYGNWMTLGLEALDRDYELAWAVLAARIKPIAGLVRACFGLGTEIRLGWPFPYWTAVELSPGAPVPPGMVSVVIPAGPYLALDKGPEVSLDEAYDFIYNNWEGTQKEYTVNHSRFCFEQYGPEGLNSGRVTLFMSLAAA